MMKKILIAAAAFTLSCGAHAATLAGDAAAGKTKSAACVACHGADGNSAAPTFPRLAGQNVRYLTKQLLDIRPDAAGKAVRPVPQMMGIVDKLTDQDIADIAAYYSTQKSGVNQAKKELVTRGEQIFRGGVRAKGVPACAACHAPDGIGNAPAGFPRLGGQHADYVATQLKGYRAGADGDPAGRHNDGDTMPMRTIASRLSDSEITALAAYISGLH